MKFYWNFTEISLKLFWNTFQRNFRKIKLIDLCCKNKYWLAVDYIPNDPRQNYNKKKMFSNLRINFMVALKQSLISLIYHKLCLNIICLTSTIIRILLLRWSMNIYHANRHIIVTYPIKDDSEKDGIYIENIINIKYCIIVMY